ncbi:hypothetical protein FJY94_07895, partial [Candidatus Kaiserbacteria bacterium]|nr:hypothetical protein [Candidatus Kaiserbacteria bacterium]
RDYGTQASLFEADAISRWAEAAAATGAATATDASVAGASAAGTTVAGLTATQIALGLLGVVAVASAVSSDDTPAIPDTVAPTATISLSDSALKIGDTATVTITFSEAVSGFALADLSAANGALSNLSAATVNQDGTVTYTATFTPTADIEDASNVISLATTYTDVAGNTGTVATSGNYAVDTKAPTATISLSDSALKIGDTSTVTITFSEAVSGFALEDLSAANGALSNLSAATVNQDGTVTYTATFTPTADIEDASNVISLATTYTDVAGNAGTVATSGNYTIDTLAPASISLTAQSVDEDAAGVGTSIVPVTFTNLSLTNLRALFDGQAATSGVSPSASFDLSGYQISGTGTVDITLTLEKSVMGNTDLVVTLQDVAISAANGVIILPAGQTLTVNIDLGPIDLGTYTFQNLDADQFVISSTGTTTTPTLEFKLDSLFARISDGNGDVLDLGNMTPEQLGAIAGGIFVGLTEGRDTGDLIALARSAITLPQSLDTVGEVVAFIQSRVYLPAISSITFGDAMAQVGDSTTKSLIVAAAGIAQVSDGDTLSAALSKMGDYYSDWLISDIAELLDNGVGLETMGSSGLVELARDIIEYALTEAASRNLSVEEIISRLAAAVVANGNDLTSILDNIDSTVLTRLLGDNPNLHEIIVQIRDEGTVNYSDIMPLAARTLFSSAATLTVAVDGITGLTVKNATNNDVSALTGSVIIDDIETNNSVNVTLTTNGGEWTYDAGTADTGVTYTALLAGDALTGSEWLKFDASTLVFSGTPTNSDVGAKSVTLRATDAAGNVTDSIFTLTVNNTNDVPTVVGSGIPDASVVEFGSLNLNVSSHFSDVDVSDRLTYTATGLPTGVTMSSSGVITGTAPEATGTNPVPYTVTVTARDGSDATVSDTFVLTLTQDTTAPTQTVSAVDISADTGTSATDFLTKTASQTITGTLSGALASGDILYGSVDNGANWINITSKVSGTAISWDGATLSGSSTILFKVADAAGNDSATSGSTAYVLDTIAPTLTITSDKSAVKAGETATITFTFSEDPGSTFTWDGTGGDVVVTNGTLGAISGTGLTRTATFAPTADLASGNASITVASASYTDAAGNNGGAGTTPSISIDTLAPTVSSVVISATGATNTTQLNAGDVVTVTATYSETVEGQP